MVVVVMWWCDCCGKGKGKLNIYITSKSINIKLHKDQAYLNFAKGFKDTLDVSLRKVLMDRGNVDSVVIICLLCDLIYHRLGLKTSKGGSCRWQDNQDFARTCMEKAQRIPVHTFLLTQVTKFLCFLYETHQYSLPPPIY